MTFNANKFSPHPKPPKREKRPRIGLNKKREPTGEREIFAAILKERGNKSQISGEVIWHISPSNFMHVLAKGQNKFPKMKLYPKNILLVTAEQHYEYDNGSHEELSKLPEWKWVFDLREELLQEYKTLI